MSPSRSQLPLLLGSCALVLTACGGGGGGSSAPVIPGPPPPPEPLYEIEPNDNAALADYIGEIYPGDFIEIQGHITECCPDPYDGFAFYSAGSVRLIITLNEANPAADLDFCIYDPYLDQVVACWETGNHPEVGVYDFFGAGEFHIVLRSYIGDSNYLLQVDVRPMPPLPATLGDGPTRSELAPSSAALQRFADYAAPRPATTSASRPVELLLLGEDGGEALLLPRGGLSPGGL